MVEHFFDVERVEGPIPSPPTTRLASANAEARSWFRPLGGLNQRRSAERVECPERNHAQRGVVEGHRDFFKVL